MDFPRSVGSNLISASNVRTWSTLPAIQLLLIVPFLNDFCSRTCLRLAILILIRPREQVRILFLSAFRNSRVPADKPCRTLPLKVVYLQRTYLNMRGTCVLLGCRMGTVLFHGIAVTSKAVTQKPPHSCCTQPQYFSHFYSRVTKQWMHPVHASSVLLVAFFDA